MFGRFDQHCHALPDVEASHQHLVSALIQYSRCASHSITIIQCTSYKQQPTSDSGVTRKLTRGISIALANGLTSEGLPEQQHRQHY